MRQGEKDARDSWLGMPGYSQPSIDTSDELLPRCEAVFARVRGAKVEALRMAYDLKYARWFFDMPALVMAGGHCIDVINSKFDLTDIGIDRIPPDYATEWVCDDSWIIEYRDYPIHLVMGRPITGIAPCVEEDPGFTNFGWLFGVDIALGDLTLRIANGLDTNMLVVNDANGVALESHRGQQEG